ncbi:MAG: hypothetical protein AUH43_06230 [Acidobacteria bacterium 13_1_40CM_65_14]|nr:MAG: hypothetical protein AUH43_06230 [Acidobacteria bacterium 13_1_40CM_65_14]OLC82214.1 MAG: hypothetical protein AUH72_07465 [Acidobacteria bacterium 13_1_40CM_4_65_8]OLE80164.1 MAG: hypothetical protein AUF76_15140 [Acidobacteria bacterium 13_1_20CM_2_65_9]
MRDFDAPGLVAAVDTFDTQAVRIDRSELIVLTRVLNKPPDRDDDLRLGDDRIAERVREGGMAIS